MVLLACTFEIQLQHFCYWIKSWSRHNPNRFFNYMLNVYFLSFASFASLCRCCLCLSYIWCIHIDNEHCSLQGCKNIQLWVRNDVFPTHIFRKCRQPAYQRRNAATM